ncbi:hemolysin E, chromosomal [Thraustotheca clavata]|uniref:Hemolysin E, chromosomal n=1 Tax=Thraustotheca clavata TaxID=74557 RepID=A0A1W0A0Z8_9STRA|nr:hemolysin E, chromosomal [Thraustotheca clavata]
MARVLASEQHVDALIAAKTSLDHYNKALDKVVLWDEFQETLDLMTKYQHDHSIQASDVIGDITTLLLNGKDRYYNATRSVFEWCTMTVPLLNAYIRSVSTGKSISLEAQKKLLSKVFSEGVKKMGIAINQLDICSKLLNEATGKLVTLTTQLQNDFNNSSEYFNQQIRNIRVAYGSAIAGSLAIGPIGFAIVVSLAGLVEVTLVRKLRNHFLAIQNDYLTLQKRNKGFANHIILATKQLNKDKSLISDLSTKATEAQVYCDIPDVLMEEMTNAAHDLIHMCENYKQRHGHSH